MNEADEAKPSEGSEMDIVSMAFSNVTEHSDLMEVVSEDQCGNGGHHGAGDMMGEDEGNDPVDMPRENGQDRPPTHIEIPLPPNAIITVNEKGEQVIELAQVIEDESESDDVNNQTCVIEHVENVEHVEQIEQIQNVGLNHEEQPGPDDGDVPMAVVGGNGLETMAFQPVQVQGQGVGGQACVVPVSMPMSLSDVQNLQRAVGAVSVGPGGESVESSSVGVPGISSCSTSADLAATASSLMVSLANIIDSGSVLAASSQALPTVTFVSGAGIPVQSLSNVSNSIGSENDILGTGLVTSNSNTTCIETSMATGAQFVHSGTTLKPVNMSESVLISQKNQLLNSVQAGTQSVPVIGHSQMSDLPSLQKQDPSTAIGNRSVFSPMTLTIRTPPGAPAVNQALINSIVNNTDVQALLKRNPGQPITIVRVPESPFERKNVPGVVTTKIVTNNEESSILRHKGGPGRPRKFSPEMESNLMPKRKRGRQPGTKSKKEDEDYLVPVSWKPVKSRTRSGRISRPPVYRTNDYRPLKFIERSDQASDADESSDVEPDVVGRVPVTLTGRVKKYQCRNCSKAYIGRGGLARHFTFEPTHGNIESYELAEGVSPKLEKSPSEDNHKLDQPTTSETPAEETPDVKQESPKTATTPDVETPPSSKGTTPDPEDDAEPEEVVREPIKKPVSTGRRGRPPNLHKDDPDFKPGMHTGTPKSTAAKSMDKRKETMRQALKFLNTDDYIDVCLPRLARQLSLWDFLISKTEADKEDIPQVLKVLQLFEELIADVRDMAVNCLEKAEDEDTDIDGILLEEDDDLARVLEFDKGWYKVSAPPLGMLDMQYSVGSVLMKRPMEVIGKDDLVDEDLPPSKKPKRESGETSQSCELQTLTQNIHVPNQKTITVHVHDGKVTSTEKGTPDPSSLKTPVGASKPSDSSTKVLTSDPIPVLIKPDPEEKPSSVQTHEQPTAPRNPGNQHLLDSSGNDKPVEDNNLAETQLGAQLQGAETTKTAEAAAEETAATVAATTATGQFHEHSTPTVVAEPMTAASALTAETPLAPDPSRTDDQHSTQLSSMNMPGPASSEADFVRAVEELTSMSVAADSSLSNIKHTDKPESIHQQVDHSESMPQQESSSSVVVPEGSTIMQMQDGTFLVQKPDGTAMQIHTPEGMTIETVQELLSVEGGQS